MSEKDYAELKALNTELGKIIECKNGTIATLANIRDRLKENVEDLKKDLKVQNEIIGKLEAENERLKQEWRLDCLKCEYKNTKADVDKYKQTLQEIKAIAEKLMADNLCNNCDGIGLDANCQDTGCPYYQMNRILDKINEVIGAE